MAFCCTHKSVPHSATTGEACCCSSEELQQRLKLNSAERMRDFRTLNPKQDVFTPFLGAQGAMQKPCPPDTTGLTDT